MDHSNQKECEGLYDDENGHERVRYSSQGISLFLLAYWIFSAESMILQHLFTHSRFLNNAFKQM